MGFGAATAIKTAQHHWRTRLLKHSELVRLAFLQLEAAGEVHSWQPLLQALGAHIVLQCVDDLKVLELGEVGVGGQHVSGHHSLQSSKRLCVWH